MPVDLTIVVENSAADEGLVSELGLAVHVAVRQGSPQAVRQGSPQAVRQGSPKSSAGRNFMFDTASTPEALSANASALGIDLSAVEAVVISHGHCDHTGGLGALLDARPGLRVYAHPRAFAKRWSDRPGEQMVPIGWQCSREVLARRGAVFCGIQAPEVLADGLLISGPVGGAQPDVDRFVAQTDDGLVRDTFQDEVFLMIRGQAGWVVLTGCCHRGLKNTLRTGRFLARGEPIVAVVGGFHLGPADEEHLADAVAALKGVNPAAVYPCHCTGERGLKYLTEHFPGRVEPVCGGTRLSF